MPKKIYDILPPKIANKVEDTIRELAVDTKKKAKKISRTIEKERKKHPFRGILIGGGIILVIALMYLYNTLPKVDIEISPTIESSSISEKITADKSATIVSAAKNVIPAQFVEVSKNGTQEFPATGISSNDAKASGTIRIYNKISPASPLTLKIGTHFLSDSGKYFITLSGITIPAMKGTTAGSIQVKVQAKETGPSYNIGPAKFSIPKLSGTSYYYTVWAESTAAMAGGQTGNSKKVTKDDIANAKDTLTKKLFEQAQDSLKSQIGNETILLDGTTSKIIVSATSDVAEGGGATKFTESATVKLQALVFKKKDAEEFVAKDIDAQLSAGKDFLPDSLKITYDSDVIDLKKGTETINIKSPFDSYYVIDTDNLKYTLKGKSADQIKSVIDEKYSGKVAQVKVDFWPFWVNSAPNNNEKINIKLNFKQ